LKGPTHFPVSSVSACAGTLAATDNRTPRGKKRANGAFVCGSFSFDYAHDPRIGPALALIHERPVKAWTVARLAKKVGYSRSPFTVRFTRVVGESPQGYITRVRLQRAAQMLKEGHDSLRAIALAAGYESESSFSKAFKRQFQKTPGHFRRLAP
jgi:transcriptional regulator GlxA family with amidase domain